MPTVTSENKAEHDRAFMEKSSPMAIKDPAMYKHFTKEISGMSKKGQSDSMSHWEAMRAHKNAAMYAKPHPVHKEHEEKAKFHAAEHRKMQRIEQDRMLKERESNAAAVNRKSMVKKGIVAGSEYEKDNMPLYKGQN